MCDAAEQVGASGPAGPAVGPQVELRARKLDRVRAGDIVRARLAVFRRRLARTRALVADALSRMKRPAVAFSGGKDSLVVLHIVHKQRPDVHAVFYDSGMEYPETVPFVEKTCARLDVPLLIVEPAMSLEEVYRKSGHLGYRGPETEPVTFSWSDVRLLLIEDCAAEAIRQLGLDGLFLGLRREESLGRRRYLAACGPIHPHSDGTLHCNPLADWQTADVWAYITSHQLPYHPVYDRTRMRPREAIRVAPYGGGTMIESGRMAWLKAEYPDLFNRFAALFPEVRQYV